MSGDNVPYQLRPNKYIDRQLFIDMLTRIGIPARNEEYAYISMGGKHLRDHFAIYRQIGIRQLLAFDYDGNIVERQKFNQPIDQAVCLKMPASAISGRIDDLEEIFPAAKHVIVWLDYTDPSERLSQLQELIEVASRLEVGDVLRVTLNANSQTVEGGSPQQWKADGFASPGAFRLAELKRQLGDLVDNDLVTIDEGDLPSALCLSVGLAMSRAAKRSSGVAFRPTLLTTYKDGQRMVTATCLAVASDQGDDGFDTLTSWAFTPGGWGVLTAIDAPDLSLKEKLTIDALLSSSAAEITGRLGFQIGSSKEQSRKAIESYQQLHRYYPSFQNVET